MAVTSIWPIKGRVDQVIEYARNPKKTTEQGRGNLTTLHAIDGVLEYAADDMKTECRSYVSCLNCRETTAAEQFMETKRYWGKLGGRVCYHGYQSFKADEVTAEIAHEIGVRLAQELWGERFEVLVATHCNTGHYHNHFVINSVSWADGKKFYNAPADYAKMREVSDQLCQEYEISVIEQPSGRAKHYAEWQAEMDGKPTPRGTIRADIDRAIFAATTERDFIWAMTEMGYEFKTRSKSGTPLKYPALKPPDAKGYFRFHKLGHDYELDKIKERILQNLRKQIPFPEMEQRLPRHYRVRGKPRKKVTGLRALYFRYCYELHIITKHPTSVKRVSFLLREDVAKLTQLDAETRYLGRNRITTIRELAQRQEVVGTEMKALTAQRRELRSKVKRLSRQGDEPAVEVVRSEISGISKRLKDLRKEVVLCESIAQRSGQVQENLGQLMRQKKSERKELTDHELFWRRSRASREDFAGGSGSRR